VTAADGDGRGWPWGSLESAMTYILIIEMDNRKFAGPNPYSTSGPIVLGCTRKVTEGDTARL
jgi:hypothetical protein